MSDKTVDLQNYKERKIIQKEFPDILDRMNSSLQLLKPYSRYLSVQQCIEKLETERDKIQEILRRHEDK